VVTQLAQEVEEGLVVLTPRGGASKANRVHGRSPSPKRHAGPRVKSLCDRATSSCHQPSSGELLPQHA
jgi:hypothetical protein